MLSEPESQQADHHRQQQQEEQLQQQQQQHKEPELCPGSPAWHCKARVPRPPKSGQAAVSAREASLHFSQLQPAPTASPAPDQAPLAPNPFNEDSISRPGAYRSADNIPKWTSKQKAVRVNGELISY